MAVRFRDALQNRRPRGCASVEFRPPGHPPPGASGAGEGRQRIAGGASRAPPPHQPSPAARLLRLPLKGGVIEFYWKPCAGLKHSPLEGESVRQGLRPQSNRWGGGNWRDRQIGESARSRAGGGQTPSSVIYRDYSHRCTGYTGSGLRILVSCFPGHPQTRGGSSAESASRAVTSRSVNPVHPVYPCS